MKMKKVFVYFGLVILILMIAFFGYLYFYNETHIPVLGYHGVLPQKLNQQEDEFTLDLETFEQEMKFLKKNHYQSLSMKELLCIKNKKCKKPHKAVVITFDDGYLNNYLYAFKVLKKYDMKATVFYIGSNHTDNYMKATEIKNMEKEYKNIQFASHSYALHYHGVKTLEELDKDMKEMKKIMDTKYYAYPYGEYNSDYIKALKKNGYQLAFTFGPSKKHRKSHIDDNFFEIPRLNISKNMSLTKFKLRLFLPL